ncbi:MAG: TonB-dependent receptor, partial [Saprospiraceae bacterium]|nr:TonB-dependent receptor [Saprospiraceae bacterium]
TLLVGIPLMAYSQGTISGIVSDERTADPLIGCNVLVKETGGGASSDIDGSYQIALPAGTYNLYITYLGYQDKTIAEVVVKDKEVTYLDIALSDEAIELNLDVVVTASALKNSENSILLLQKKSDKIQDGISSQEMSRLAVGDAAGAMQKVTGANVQGGKYVYIRGLGDRYSLSQLNGMVMPSTDPYRNGAQLDLIPTELLDNIITAKTFTPDQPGTFTGGNIDLQTKSFPEQFTFTVSASTGYNQQNNFVDNFLTHHGGSKDWLGFDDGTRKQPVYLREESTLQWLNKNGELRSRFGNQEAAQTVDQAIKSLSTEFDPYSVRTPLDHGLALSFGNQYKVFGNKLGVIVSANYKRSYSNLANYVTANWTLFDVNSSSLFNVGDFDDNKSTENPILNGMVGLAYKLGASSTIKFNAIYNNNTEKTSRYVYGHRPDNIIDPLFLQGRALMFNQRNMQTYQLSGSHVINKWNETRIEWSGARTNSFMLEPDSRFFTNVYNAKSNIYTIPLSDIEQPFHFFRDLNDKQNVGKLDITVPLNASRTTKIKFGGLYSQKDRDFSEYRYQIESSQFAAPFAGSIEDFLAPSNLGVINYDEARNRYYIGNYLEDATLVDNNYIGHDIVYAGYGMLSFDVFDKLRFIGGARYEKTDLRAESQLSTKADSLRIGQINEDDFLPSLNLVYGVNEDMNIRASFSQTIARPNMRELAPFSSYDPLTKEYYIGNPKLERTLINNVDLRWEWFTRPGEILALSGYYKHFDNPITLQYLRSSNPEIQYTNVSSGELYGLEFEFRKDLDFISQALRDFRFSTNLSLIKSRMEVKNQITALDPETRPFDGQSPYIVNVALNYVNQETNWDVILALNMLGDRLSLIGREGTPDIYDRGRSQLDLTITKKIADLSVRLTAKNLLNSPYVRSSIFKDTEFVYTKYYQGVTLGLSVGYTIH